MYWLLVRIVESLKSSHKGAPGKLIFCEDYKDLASTTSNVHQIPYNIHIAISVVYDTFKKNVFEHSCSYCLDSILHFNFEMKLYVLLL